MRDPLHDMVRALRETEEGEHPDPRRSRALILSAFGARQKRRKLHLAVIIPLAAVLGLSSAWGAAGPMRRLAWARLFEQATSHVTAPVLGAHPAPVLGAHPAPGPVPQRDPVSLAQDGVQVESLAPVEPAKPRVAPRAAASSTLRAKGDVKAPKAAAEAQEPAAPRDEDADLRLYTTAHRAHFIARDTAVALAAWDAYLAACPSGRFAVEARYNRALCLLRLGRTTEAKAALSPFAQGQYGDYRGEDARRLLKAAH